MRLFAAVTLTWGLLGCGAAPASGAVVPAVSDGGQNGLDASVEAPALTLDLGTGPPGTFQPVHDGQQVLLQRGCQGAQHIFFSLRARHVRSDFPRLTLTVEQVESGRVVSLPFSYQLPPQRLDRERAQWTGLTPVIEEPRDVLGGVRLRLRARIEDDGVIVEQAREVTAQWGPNSC